MIRWIFSFDFCHVGGGGGWAIEGKILQVFISDICIL